jgi:hypothetical protein
MLKKKIVVGGIFILLMITLGIIFKPAPASAPESSIRTLGTIEEVLETRHKNVVFKLKDDDRLYYIKKDLGRGLTFRELQEKLAGKSVEIYYVNRWTPIDPLRVKHVTKVDLNKMTLYTSTLAAQD